MIWSREAGPTEFYHWPALKDCKNKKCEYSKKYLLYFTFKIHFYIKRIVLALDVDWPILPSMLKYAIVVFILYFVSK